MPSIAFISVDTNEPYGATLSFEHLLANSDSLGSQHSGLFSINPGYLAERGRVYGLVLESIEFTWHQRKSRWAMRVGFVTQKLRCLVSMTGFILRSRFDVVYVNTCFYSLPAFAGWLTRRPVILHMRDSAYYLRDGGLYRKIRKWVFRHCVTRYIAVSQHAANDIRRMIGNVDITVVYNGIDPAPYLPSGSIDARTARAGLGLPSEGPVVVMVNRIDPSKGIEDFIDIADICHTKNNEIQFVLVGGPVDSEYFRRQIGPMIQRRHYVTAVGYQADVSAYLHAADVFLNTTMEEQFGRANVEAMAAGKCVVSRAAGAVPEIVTDGATGYLFPAHSIDVAAELVLQLIGDSNKRTAIGTNARKAVVAEFSLTRVTSQLRDVVTSLSNER